MGMNVTDELLKMAIKARDYLAKTDGYNDGDYFENKFMNELEEVIAQCKKSRCEKCGRTVRSQEDRKRHNFVHHRNIAAIGVHV